MSQVISLEKNQVVSLSKGLNVTKALFGLGWKPVRRGARVDLDACCIAVDSSGHGSELVFYNHKIGVGGAVSLSGDDLTGADDGEGANAPDESITIDLELVPDNIDQLLLLVNSYSGQTFGAVEDVFVLVTDYYTHEDLLEYDLDAEYTNDKAVVVGKLSRSFDDTSEWEFTAVGKGIPGGLKEFLKLYHMSV